MRLKGEVDSEPKFYSRRTIFSDTGADSENFLCVFDQRSQIDKYCAKIPATAPVTPILNPGGPHPPQSELECPDYEPLRFAFEQHPPLPGEISHGFTVQPLRRRGGVDSRRRLRACR